MSFPTLPRSRARRAAAALGLALAAACGSDSTTTPQATALALVSGDAQSGIVGTTLAVPVVLVVRDGSGNPVSGVTVTWSVNATANGTAPAASVSDAAGQVSATWMLGTAAGTDTLTAAATGLPTFSVTASASPDVPASVAVSAGDAQAAVAGSVLTAPLAVRVTDRYGNPVPDVAVQWSDDANGALANALVYTDASGVAQDALTLPGTAGMDDVTATITTPSGPVAATLHESGS